MQKQRSRRQAHHAEDPVESLRKHPLNLASHETRRGQIEIRKSQHVALDAPFFFLIKRHHHQHGGKRAWCRCNRLETVVLNQTCAAEQIKSESKPRPQRKCNGEQPIRQCFLTPADWLLAVTFALWAGLRLALYLF